MKKQIRSASKALRHHLLGLAMLGVLQTSLAQDGLLQNAQRLIGARQPAQAYQLLSPHEAARAGKPEFDYLLGLAALDSGRVTQAIFAFERVLALQPTNSLARAELARAYIAAGETDTAKSQLQQVQTAQDVPSQARESVERLLSSLAKGASKPLRAHVEAGLGRDSNLSGGPNASSFAVPALGAVFTLTPAARQRGDTALQLATGLAYTHALSASTDFNAQLNLRTTRPLKEHSLDSSSLDGSLGIAHTALATRYSLSLQLANLSFDGKTNRKTTGLMGQAIHQLNGANQLMGFVQLARFDFPTQALRDARRTVLGGAWGLALSPATSAYLGFALGGEQADKVAGAEFGYRLTGLRAGAEHATSGQTRLFANLGVERRKHRANDSVFLSERSDQQVDLSLGVHHQLHPTSYGHWRITPQLNWTGRSSNFNVYDMRRTQLGVIARLDF
jgi:outer membrane protein